MVDGLRARIAVARWRAEARRAPEFAPWSGPESTRPPIFVGGTGRSGTTITAKILAAHPAYVLIPYEVHFITDPGGMSDLVSGKVTIGQFERHFVERWFVRHTGNGLHRFARRELVATALRELRLTFERDGLVAARRFVYRLFDPVARAAGAEGWIEMTPNNGEAAATLQHIFPDAMFVHAVRDGRDVASSVVSMGWGPSDPIDALRWWGRRVGKAFESFAALPPDRAIAVQMEALTTTDRDSELARLLAFAGLTEHPEVRAFFETRVSAERSHGGRWRREVPPERLDLFVAVYEAIAAELRGHGWPYTPATAALEPAGAVAAV